MKLFLSLSALGALALLIRWTRQSARERVSPNWLVEHAYQERGKGIDSVNWKWPVKKLHNESPIWNRAQQRRRA